MIFHVNSCSPVFVFARGLPLLFSAAGLWYEKKCMTWLFLGTGSVGCINRLKHSFYGVFRVICTPRMCLRNGMLDMQLLPPPPSPKREMAKETSALKPQIFAELGSNHKLSVCKVFQGVTVVFLKHPSSPALLAGIWRSSCRHWVLGAAREGSLSCPAGVCLEVSPLKRLDLVKGRESLHLFWQLLRTGHALFIIITLLMVFTKWQSQVL